MNKSTKKVTALILCLAMCMGMAISTAYAAGKVADSLKDASSGKKAIIVIPGIGASELYKKTASGYKKIWVSEELMEVKCDENGEPIVDTFALDDNYSQYGVINLYEKLVKMLRENFDSRYGGSGEYEVRFFSYDWRLSNQKAAAELNDFIENNGYDSVILVAHSMGGIVSSIYMAEHGYDRIEKFITLGTPYYGAPKAVYAFETGKVVDNIFHVEDALIKYFAPNITGIYELLPIEESFGGGNGYIYYKDDTLLKTLLLSKPLNYEETCNLIKEQSWYNEKLFETAEDTYTKQYARNTLSGVYSDIRKNKVDSYIIAGYNTETVNGVVYSDEGLEDILTSNGDGIVPLMSATMNNAKFARAPYYVKNVSHAFMTNSKNVAQLVVNIINGKGDTLSYAKGCDLFSVRRTAPLDTAKKNYKLTVDTPIINRMFDKAMSMLDSLTQKLSY